MRLLLIILIVIYSGFLSAHKNTGLELKDNGTVIGLPHKYEPASFERNKFPLRPNASTTFFSPVSDKPKKEPL